MNFLAALLSALCNLCTRLSSPIFLTGFKKNGLSQVKIKNAAQHEPLPHIWMSTLVRNRLLAERMNLHRFLGSYPSPSSQSSIFYHSYSHFFSNLQKIAFFGPRREIQI